MTAQPKKTFIPDVIFENAKVRFRNFSGKEGTYNKAGDRNFALFLTPVDAENMRRDGWNVKQLPPREDAEPQDYLPVKVSYKGRPPRVVLITSRGRTPLAEDDINILDFAEFKNVDLKIHPYPWDVNGKTGITAYLASIFVTIVEDELDLKYADVPDVPTSAQNAIPEDQLPFAPWE